MDDDGEVNDFAVQLEPLPLDEAAKVAEATCPEDPPPKPGHKEEGKQRSPADGVAKPVEAAKRFVCATLVGGVRLTATSGWQDDTAFF